MAKVENEKITQLNRNLTQELEVYQNKDTLKEAQYIIEGQYNTEYLPDKYKFIFKKSKNPSLFFMNSDLQSGSI